MNFLALEQKFKVMDKREADMRSFFDPQSLSGKKHKFIKDLKADYEFDNLIYGLGKYVTENRPKPKPQHLEMKVEDTPKAQEVASPSQKKNFRAKLRNPSAFHMIEPLSKEVYEGVFCNTKIVKPEILNEKKVKEEKAVLEGELPKWTAKEVGAVSANPAARDEPKLLFPKIERNAHKTNGSPKRTEVSQERKVLIPDQTSAPRESFHSSFSKDSPLSPDSPSKPLKPIYPPDYSSDQLPTDETINLSAPLTDSLIMRCSKQVQSPFSENPLVYFESEIPKVRIKLIEDVFRDVRARYTLQLTDLSVTGYPLAHLEGLKCEEGSDWVRTEAGEVDIDLRSLINDYKSVQQHTVRLVLFAKNEKRRLIERLLFFGLKDWKSEAKVVLELERFRAYLKQTIKGGRATHFSVSPKKDTEKTKAGGSTFHCLLRKVQKLRNQSSTVDVSIPDFDSMKITTPHKMQMRPTEPPLSLSEAFSVSPAHLPALSASPQKSYKNPITHGLLNYRAEDLQYHHELYAANLLYLEDQVRFQRAQKGQSRSPERVSSPEQSISVMGQQVSQSPL